MNYETGYLGARDLADQIAEQASSGKSVAGLGGARRKKSSADTDKYELDTETTDENYGALSVGSVSSFFEDVDREAIQEYLDSLEEESAAEESMSKVRPQYRPGSISEEDLSEKELLAITLQAEAGGEGLEGMLAAGAVIDNRARSGKYGEGIRGVILKPGQFSAWNGVTGYAGGEGAIDMDKVKASETALEAAEAILTGEYEDPTGGATHYYNDAVANPVWGQEKAGGDWMRIGNHLFGFADAGSR